MQIVKIFTLCFIFSLLFVGCVPKQNLEKSKNKRIKKIDYLYETKDINNIKELEVSNNLLQILPVITISGVEILMDDEIEDSKPILFRNEKCIFQGMAHSDINTKRIKVQIDKATCRTKFNHKVNYIVNGWALAEDGMFGLKAIKEVLNTQEENSKNKRKVILKIKEGEYSYLSIDMVKQIETILIKKYTPKTSIIKRSQKK